MYLNILTEPIQLISKRDILRLKLHYKFSIYFVLKNSELWNLSLIISYINIIIYKLNLSRVHHNSNFLFIVLKFYFFIRFWKFCFKPSIKL